MATAIKPKPGTYNGVRYRSQLEIKWVQFFDRMSWKWKYTDTHTHDFECEFFGDVEIKPSEPELIIAAMDRIWDAGESNGIAAILAGNPPSQYSHAHLLHGIKLNGGLILTCCLAWSVNDKPGYVLESQQWGYSRTLEHVAELLSEYLA